MQLIIENTNKSFPFPKNGTLLVGNDFECDVQINHPKVWGRHFAINQKPYGCVLEIYNESVQVNEETIERQCMLDPGDWITIGDIRFQLVDDQYIPKDSALNHTNVEFSRERNVSSVYGLRSHCDLDAGFFVIDDLHHEAGWHVFRQDNALHFMDSKNTAQLNGLSIAQAKLRNGDVILGDGYKFKVELPGTSGFSKFSPSHPRNVQLSEAFQHTDQTEKTTRPQTAGSSFLKNNLWWLTLLVGLIVLVLVIINNPNSSI